MTTILLADDHPFMRAGVEAVLRTSQFEVIATAANGDEALSAVKRYDPVICIFDVRMPRRNGVEALEAMRAEGDLRPVVLLTAEIEDAVLISAVRARVNGIVLKGGAPDALLSCLDAVVAGRSAIPQELMQRALDLSLKATPHHPFDGLSQRECQIAEHVGQGMRNRAIAQSLGMSEGTVKVYLHKIYQKLGLENRTELALMCQGQAAPSRNAP